MKELYTFLMFILTGLAIGTLFDIFRILRRSFKTKDFITYIEDILFWIFTGIILLYSIFTFNNGELRAFVFIGVLLGIILYILTLSRYFIKICVYIVNIIKMIITLPIKFLVNLLRKIFIIPLTRIIVYIKHFLKKIISKNKLNLKIDKKEVNSSQMHINSLQNKLTLLNNKNLIFLLFNKKSKNMTKK